jgi:hypothetical protein
VHAQVAPVVQDHSFVSELPQKLIRPCATHQVSER